MRNCVVLMGLGKINFFLCFYHFTFNLVQFSKHKRLFLHVQNEYFTKHICFSLEATKPDKIISNSHKNWACFALLSPGFHISSQKIGNSFMRQNFALFSETEVIKQFIFFLGTLGTLVFGNYSLSHPNVF